MDRPPDPPPAFSEAVARFSKFLVENGYPPSVRWILADQIALTTERNYLIKFEGAAEGRIEAERRYSIGIENGLGILLHAVCATADETISSVYIPASLADAQNHLMGPRLKLSCPVERPPALVVESASEWAALGHDIQAYSRMMRDSFEL